MKGITRKAIGVLIGAMAGLGITFLARCSGGGCPMARSPVILVVLGGLLGGIIASKRD